MTFSEMVPNPGSDIARLCGCKCPVVANDYGRKPSESDDGWTIDPDCEMHGWVADATADGEPA